MKSRITRSRKIGKGTYKRETYRGYGDYFVSGVLARFIALLIVLFLGLAIIIGAFNWLKEQF